jgi:hypothetical protein
LEADVGSAGVLTIGEMTLIKTQVAAWVGPARPGWAGLGWVSEGSTKVWL